MSADGPRLLTVDYEAWYHALALAPWLPEDMRGSLPDRLERVTEELLALFAEVGARATFFVLGEVARRRPRLVRAIAEAGHEIASHGHAHRPLWAETPASFRRDVARAKAVLEDVAGTPVVGYRAPNFSLGPGTAWAAEVLAGTGHRYSSSHHPVLLRGRGGGQPRHVHRRGGLLEIPLPTLGGLPFAGGAWARLLPAAWMRTALRLHRPHVDRPLVLYLHPWELDPGQPRLPQLPLRVRLRHYAGIHRLHRLLPRLLRRHGPWRAIREVLPELEAAVP
ncbi:Peptidoglycan deacetylase [bacterium HR39]|nr:Peptidoglycan deacetylase [bacterium HR39]